ncbi:hypothetical protein ASF28_17560 [Methylobacterium sp. Leaf99]|nr:hypothetical protein ASF28_17560 [Methylobacterium sp. Leaf99]
MVGDLGEDHHGRHDEEDEGPGRQEAQGRFDEAAQGADAVESGDLEQDHGEGGDAEDRRDVARTEEHETGQLQPVRGEPRDADDGEVGHSHAARQDHGREDRSRCRSGRGLGRGDGRHGVAFGRFLTGGRERSCGGFQEVTDVEGAHRQGFRTSISVAAAATTPVLCRGGLTERLTGDRSRSDHGARSVHPATERASARARNAAA